MHHMQCLLLEKEKAPKKQTSNRRRIPSPSDVWLHEHRACLMNAIIGRQVVSTLLPFVEHELRE